MKKSSLILLHLLFSISIFAQLEFNTLYQKVEPGKCFAAIPKDTSVWSEQFIQLLPPVYDTTWIAINEEFLQQHFSTTELTSKDSLRLEIRTWSHYYVKTTIDKYCVNYPNPQFMLSICVTEIPAQYIYLHKDS